MFIPLIDLDDSETYSICTDKGYFQVGRSPVREYLDRRQLTVMPTCSDADICYLLYDINQQPVLGTDEAHQADDKGNQLPGRLEAMDSFDSIPANGEFHT
jgi:hypothetical protein